MTWPHCKFVTLAALCGTLISPAGCSNLGMQTPKPLQDQDNPMVTLLRDRETALSALRADMAAVRIDAAKKEAELSELRETVVQLRRDLGESRQAMLELRQAAETHQAELSSARQERDQLRQVKSDPVPVAGTPALHETVVRLNREVQQLKQGLAQARQTAHSVRTEQAPPALAQAELSRPARLDTPLDIPVDPPSTFFLQTERETDTLRDPIRVIVQPGDTLWSLARRYHTTVKAIQRENRLTGERLEHGKRLLIDPETQE